MKPSTISNVMRQLAARRWDKSTREERFANAKRASDAAAEKRRLCKHLDRRQTESGRTYCSGCGVRLKSTKA